MKRFHSHILPNRNKRLVRNCLPTVERDLPGNARRLVQKAEGIRATVVNGAVAFENCEFAGAYAGEVLKGKLAPRSA